MFGRRLPWWLAHVCCVPRLWQACRSQTHTAGKWGRQHEAVCDHCHPACAWLCGRSGWVFEEAFICHWFNRRWSICMCALQMQWGLTVSPICGRLVRAVLFLRELSINSLLLATFFSCLSLYLYMHSLTITFIYSKVFMYSYICTCTVHLFSYFYLYISILFIHLQYYCLFTKLIYSFICVSYIFVCSSAYLITYLFIFLSTSSLIFIWILVKGIILISRLCWIYQVAPTLICQKHRKCDDDSGWARKHGSPPPDGHSRGSTHEGQGVFWRPARDREQTRGGRPGRGGQPRHGEAPGSASTAGRHGRPHISGGRCLRWVWESSEEKWCWGNIWTVDSTFSWKTHHFELSGILRDV